MSRLQLVAVVGVVVVAACRPSPTPPESRPAVGSAPAPAVAPPAPAPVAAPPPAPPPPTTCAADADCNFADGVQPARCIVGPAPAADKQPDGSCVCLAGACALRPNRTRISQLACEWTVNNCELEMATGRCEPDIASDVPRRLPYGPTCACDRSDQRCHLRWFDAVPCKTVDDCWSTEQPVPHAIPRPPRLRGRKFRGCVDGENVPTCVDGRCGLDGLMC